MNTPVRAAPARTDAATPVLAVRDLRKAYGPTKALTGCSFAIAPGEIRAVLGENGSGKSTLVKILSGVLPPDSGTVAIGGTPVAFRSPRAAQAAGVVTVFQETLVVPELSVLDNIFVGTDRLFGWAAGVGEQRRGAAALLDRLGSGTIDLDAPIEALPLERRQIVAIVRALARPWRLLILDEATSALDVGSRDALFAYLRQQRTDSAVLFISHRMDEIAAIADAVTLLQSGESTASLPIAAAPAELLVSLISRSRDAAGAGHGPAPVTARGNTAGGPAVVRARDVVLRPGARPVDLAVAPGEIIGFGGLDGHGQADMLAALAAIRRPVAGTIEAHSDGAWQAVATARDAVRHGIAYVPRDRKTEGLFAPLPILDNYGVATLRRWSRLSFIDRAGLRRRAKADLDALRTRYPALGAPVARLSGGNQQKVLLARWLAVGPRVLVLNDPLRGVDAATKADIHAVFRDLAADGMALLLLSSEIEELLLLCDRVLVFRDGQVGRTLAGAALSREAIVAAMFGQEEPPPVAGPEAP